MTNPLVTGQQNREHDFSNPSGYVRGILISYVTISLDMGVRNWFRENKTVNRLDEDKRSCILVD